MTSISPEDRFTLWFSNLSQFKTACNNTTVNQMDWLTFANATVTDYLLTDTEQKTFLVSVASSTGYDDMSAADLTTYKTFLGLLNHWNPLINSVAVLLQSLSTPELQQVPSSAYFKATAATAFPGGSSGPAWTTAMSSLQSNIEPVCFSTTFQNSVNACMDKPATTMKDLATQIAVLG